MIFAHTGQRIDSETNGLYYYRTRHYSPLLGRFLQTDTAGTNGGINLYAYARNNPLNLRDVTGKAPDAPSSVAPPQNFSFNEEIDEEGEQTVTNTATSQGAGPTATNLPIPYYPPNNGFADTPDYELLQPGTSLGRYGGEGGTYLAPAGTPAISLSLPPGTTNLPYNVYTVLQPLPVLSGQATPYFGQFGGGTQYLTFDDVRTLIQLGYLQ